VLSYYKEEKMECKVLVYALSTCGWCHKTLKWFEDNKIVCDTIYVDELTGKEKERVMEEVKKYNPSRSFPTVVIDGGRVVVVGFKPEELKKELL
jgi:glutaredoxin-like protein NrdH